MFMASRIATVFARGWLLSAVAFAHAGPDFKFV